MINTANLRRKQMDGKFQQLIEVLATRLGTTVEHLWGVLVRQAPISGAVDLALCILLAAATAWWVAQVKRKTTYPKPTDGDKYPSPEWEGEGAVLAWAVAFIAGVFDLIYIIRASQGIVAAFANPEYWALTQLVK